MSQSHIPCLSPTLLIACLTLSSPFTSLLSLTLHLKQLSFLSLLFSFSVPSPCSNTKLPVCCYYHPQHLHPPRNLRKHTRRFLTFTSRTSPPLLIFPLSSPHLLFTRPTTFLLGTHFHTHSSLLQLSRQLQPCLTACYISPLHGVPLASWSP